MKSMGKKDGKIYLLDGKNRMEQDTKKGWEVNLDWIQRERKNNMGVYVHMYVCDFVFITIDGDGERNSFVCIRLFECVQGQRIIFPKKFRNRYIPGEQMFLNR